MNDLLLRYRFRLLLLSTILLTLVMGWPHPDFWWRGAALLLLVLTALNTLRHKKVFKQLALWIGASNLVLLAAGQLIDLPKALADGMTLIAFYLLLCTTLFRRVTTERPVTHELLYGLCALYLQIALAFAFTFHVANGLLPGAFSVSTGEVLELDDFVYYSLVTLTTVGYGDIHAIHPLVRLLAGLEGVVGVMFIALGVARSLALMSDDL